MSTVKDRRELVCISLKIPQELLERLDHVADYRESTRTSVILFCLKQKLPEIEREIE